MFRGKVRAEQSALETIRWENLLKPLKQDLGRVEENGQEKMTSQSSFLNRQFQNEMRWRIFWAEEKHKTDVRCGNIMRVEDSCGL